jgi:hypothetical protein
MLPCLFASVGALGESDPEDVVAQPIPLPPPVSGPRGGGGGDDEAEGSPGPSRRLPVRGGPGDAHAQPTRPAHTPCPHAQPTRPAHTPCPHALPSAPHAAPHRPCPPAPQLPLTDETRQIPASPDPLDPPLDLRTPPADAAGDAPPEPLRLPLVAFGPDPHYWQPSLPPEVIAAAAAAAAAATAAAEQPMLKLEPGEGVAEAAAAPSAAVAAPPAQEEDPESGLFRYPTAHKLKADGSLLCSVQVSPCA